MAFPTVQQMQDAYDALTVYKTEKQLASLEGFINDATNTVLGLVARLYDVSGFEANTPPQVYTWIKRLSYALIKQKAHLGSAEDTGDKVAADTYDKVLKEIEKFLTPPGQGPLLDADRKPIALLPSDSYPAEAGGQTCYVRTSMPMHSAGPPERSFVVQPLDDYAPLLNPLNRSKWK